MKLKNDQHEEFCQQYLFDLNGTKAAERAKYSKKTAAQQASRLLSNVKIQKRIAKLQQERGERAQVTQDMVIKELALIAFSDMAELLEIEEGGLIIAKKFTDMKENQSRILKAVKEDRIIRETPDGKSIVVHDKIRYEVWDKLRALELVGKHLGMFITEKLDIGDELKKILVERIITNVNPEGQIKEE